MIVPIHIIPTGGATWAELVIGEPVLVNYNPCTTRL